MRRPKTSYQARPELKERGRANLLIVDYIENKKEPGVEPVCAALTSTDLKISPASTTRSKGGRCRPERCATTPSGSTLRGDTAGQTGLSGHQGLSFLPACYWAIINGMRPADR